MWMIWRLLPGLVIHGDDWLIGDSMYLDSVLDMGMGTKDSMEGN